VRETRPPGRFLRHRLPGEHSYGLVLVLIVAWLLFAAAAPDDRWSRAVRLLVAGAAVPLAFWTSRARRRVVHAVIVVVSVGVVAGITALFARETESFFAVSGVVGILFIAVVPFTIARGISRQPEVTLQSIFGAASIYLLIGMFFAFLYDTVSLLGPDRFFAQRVSADPDDFLYFSFVTLTTVGYGDVTAATDVGRTLAIFEALLGQLYLVTVVALIVGSLAGKRRGAG
jgi:voltage-gated potassium channel Kch